MGFEKEFRTVYKRLSRLVQDNEEAARADENLDRIKDKLGKESYWKARILILSHKIPDPELFLMDRFVELGWGAIPKTGAAKVKTELLYMAKYGEADAWPMEEMKTHIEDWNSFLAFFICAKTAEEGDKNRARMFLKKSRKDVQTKIRESWLKEMSS